MHGFHALYTGCNLCKACETCVYMGSRRRARAGEAGAGEFGLARVALSVWKADPVPDDWEWFWAGESGRDRLLRDEIEGLQGAASVARSQSARLSSQLAHVQGSMERRLSALAAAFDAYVELGDVREQLAGFPDTSATRREATAALRVLTRDGTPERLAEDQSGYWLAPAMNAVIALAAGSADAGRRAASGRARSGGRAVHGGGGRRARATANRSAVGSRPCWSATVRSRRLSSRCGRPSWVSSSGRSWPASARAGSRRSPPPAATGAAWAAAEAETESPVDDPALDREPAVRGRSRVEPRRANRTTARGARRPGSGCKPWSPGCSNAGWGRRSSSSNAPEACARRSRSPARLRSRPTPAPDAPEEQPPPHGHR